MAHQTRVFLFGDQTYDFVPSLRALLRTTDNPLLTAFLDQSHYVIRAQMNHHLPLKERTEAGTQNLSNLLQKYCDGGLNPAFQTALACICQLGCFISQYGEAGRPYPRPEDTYVLGLCTGGLAAAAVSSCSTLSELLPAAVQTVQVAFRLGLCAADVRDRIETPSKDIPREWSMVISGLEPKEAAVAVKNFCEANVSGIAIHQALIDLSQVLPKTSQPWIGATAPKATTISGPPTVLKQMRESPLFANFKTKTIPIFVPSHTSHLFTSEDVTAILETTSTNSWIAYASKIPIISSATGKLAWAKNGNFRALLERSLAECLLEPLRWDRVIEGFPMLLQSRGTGSVAITPIATNAEQTLLSSLKGSLPAVIDRQNVHTVNLPHGAPSGKSKLAIVGMSGRFPESQSPAAFWDLLYEGLDVCKQVPARRWNVETHVDPTGKGRNKGATPWGCWLDFAGEFDPRFFSISPKEAPQIDPASRMALMSTFEAMEQAGIAPGTTPSTQLSRVGVFHGVTSNDWMESNAAQDIDTYFITGGNRGFIPGRINFCFEFSGPSYTNDTACSSSLAAIHLACNSLWRGDCDTAVAGGTNMIFNPDGHAGLDKGFFLSRTGNCKTYDDNADGYCRAEAVGTVFIKRLEDALAENDPILAVILDTQTNHSAMSDSMTRPHVGAQIDNMNAAINNACVDPNSFSYVEMHGTGTQVGDAVEMESVLSVFAPKEGSRGPDQPLFIGSAKANIGHGEGASGVTSLVKVLLMMKHNTIPPHCGIKPGSKINHTYPDLGARNVHIAFKPTPWVQKDQPRRVLINNFSAAGGNTALVLEDAPARVVSDEHDPRDSYPVAVSGHVASTLKRNLQSLLDFISSDENKGVSLPQLSWTTTARRVHQLHRVSVNGSSISEIKAQLQEAIVRGDGMTRAKSKPTIVFAFTGQGSQYLGMGKPLFDAFPHFRADLRRFDQLARALDFPSFLPIITSSDADIDDFPPVVVQLAICSLQMALSALLMSFGVTPGAVVGHSLGEYAALNTAGVLTASDTIYIVGKRAELLQERCNRGTHAMLAVKSSRAAIAKLLIGKRYEIACINGPEETVLSGSTEQITAAQSIIAVSGLNSTTLKVPFAFHSAQVDPILESFEAVARGATFHKPTIPVLCPLSGDVVTKAGTFNAAYLAQHCRGTVNIEAALRRAKESQFINDKSITVEVGPQPVVCGMVKATLGAQMSTYATLDRKKGLWRNLSSVLGALYAGSHKIDWTEYHSAFKSCHKVLELPSYKWELKDYFIPYQNDWCLHKNDLSAITAPTSAKPTLTPAPKVEPAKAPTPKLESTTIHRVVEESIETLGATIIVETDVSRPDVSRIAQGHKVHNISLCTPSVYADIGLTVGKYMMNRLRPGYPGIVDISDLVIDKALVPHGQGPQLLRTSMKVDWAPKAAGATKSAKCMFYSVNANGKTTTKHAWCTVRFEDRTQLQALQKRLPEFKEKINHLREGIKKGQFVKYSTASGYKLIGNLAHFHPDYRLLDDVVLAEGTLEGCSTMSFAPVKPGGVFAAHPAYVDAITQIGGFTMNAKDSTDLDNEVYINHGWESFQVYEEMRTDKKYETYVQMKDDGGDLAHGDTIMLDGDTIVAFFKGVSLRKVVRKGLNMVLQQAADSAPGGKKKAATPAAKAAAIPDSVPVKTTVTVPVPVPAPAPLPTSTPAAITVQPRVTFAVVPAASEAKPTVTAPKAKPTDPKAIAALEIVSEESGIAFEDLTDDCNFADIGVDSLLSMVIGSRFREELNIDLETDFSIFVDLPTVKHLKEFFGGPSEDPAGDEAGEQVVREASNPLPASPSPTPVKVSAPSDTQVLIEQATSIPEQTAAPVELPLPPSTEPEAPTTVSTNAQAALEIVAEESGVALEDLTDDSNFADIGVDSLLSMVIGSRFREELNIDLETDFSIFVDLPTVKDLKQFFSNDNDNASDSDMSSYVGVSATTTPDETPHDSDSEEPTMKLYPYCRPSSSVILQGIPKTAQKTLFFLPDGSGSSSSYVPVPRLKADVAVIGLNCPYARDPENMNCTHVALMESFCKEIRRRQPQGPYHIGGWSSGGAFAYACAETLVNQGEEVHSLIIIDAPVPQVMDRLPRSFYEHCNQVGLFAGGAPDYLIPHFQQTVEVMMPYKVAPLKTNRMPKVGILWATGTVMDEKTAPKLKGMHFMVHKRTDFGPDGWDAVLPGAEFVIDRAEGANHFSLMQKEHIYRVSNLIDKVMA